MKSTLENQFELGIYSTLLLATVVLIFGFFLVKKIKFLRDFNIPEPVVGGICVSIILYILYAFFKIQFSFCSDLRVGMMLIFFSSIGLGADFLLLKKGGKPLLIFIILTGAFIITQDLLGVSISKLLGLSPAYGLIAGSITLTGGHGTGAAWADTLGSTFHLSGTMELAMACATFGLVFGGIIGGPVARYLIKRNRNILSEIPKKDDEKMDIEFEFPERQKEVTVMSIISSLFMFSICLIGGFYLDKILKNTVFQLPTFVWCLFIGTIVRNLSTHALRVKVHLKSIDLIGTFGLYLFLAIALMELHLWTLTGLALPVLLILFLQVSAIILWSIFVTFKAMGKNYDAVVLTSGHCGFGLGATPTAIANMQTITEHFGPSHKSFIIVPIVGAFFVDIMNNLIIKLFVLFI